MKFSVSSALGTFPVLRANMEMIVWIKNIPVVTEASIGQQYRVEV